MSSLSEKLQKVSHLLRLLDVDIERYLNPHLQTAEFNAVTGQLGPHLYVLSYTTDVKAALTLPQANPHLNTALDIVIDWLKRNPV